MRRLALELAIRNRQTFPGRMTEGQREILQSLADGRTLLTVAAGDVLELETAGLVDFEVSGRYRLTNKGQEALDAT